MNSRLEKLSNIICEMIIEKTENIYDDIWIMEYELNIPFTTKRLLRNHRHEEVLYKKRRDIILALKFNSYESPDKIAFEKTISKIDRDLKNLTEMFN